jgi:cytochrome P450
MTSPALAPGLGFARLPATPGARWLAPSAWPDEAGAWFRAAPPDISVQPTLITRYADVIGILHAPGSWRRQVPEWVLPASGRHIAYDASWGVDGDEHALLWRAVRRINRGSTPQARSATRALTSQLLARLMSQRRRGPWNLAEVIYPVSMHVILEHTLAAPPLLPLAPQIAERVRAFSAAPAGFTGLGRDEAFEDLLMTADRQAGNLPEGLARDLARERRDGMLTPRQLTAQLALIVLSYETQATLAANLIAMILEGGCRDEASRATRDARLMRRLVAEGGRRGPVFPVSLFWAARQVNVGGQTIREGEPALVSWAAANMDPAVFGDGAAAFNPEAEREPHLAFGAGSRRCQGETGAEQFAEDVTRALLDELPPGTALADDGMVLRETAGMTWSIAELPVTSRERA